VKAVTGNKATIIGQERGRKVQKEKKIGFEIGL
jgi:hypothetical protein